MGRTQPGDALGPRLGLVVRSSEVNDKAKSTWRGNLHSYRDYESEEQPQNESRKKSPSSVASTAFLRRLPVKESTRNGELWRRLLAVKVSTPRSRRPPQPPTPFFILSSFLTSTSLPRAHHYAHTAGNVAPPSKTCARASGACEVH
jgi:hypothetical protein